MEGNNLQVKRCLIIQSFSPLFVLLTIKYCNIGIYWSLIHEFFAQIRQGGFEIIVKAFNHSAFGGLFVFVLGALWFIAAIIIALGFKGLQNSGFKSSGEQIIISNTESDGSAIFLVTYILPLLTDDIVDLRGLIEFLLLLFMIIALLINSKSFYHNPILAMLKYKTYSFKFLNPDRDIENSDAEYICITYGDGISPEAPIKRKHISDGVFLIVND